MKRSSLLLALALLGLTVSAPAANKTLTEDPLTGLPIIPTPDRPHLGNAPTVLPDTEICNSNAKMNLYPTIGLQVDATVVWYTEKLPGFKRTHAWASGRSQDTFYKPDGTVMVSITGKPAANGQNTDVYALIYGKFAPAISEKAIIGMNTQNVVCK